MSAFVAMEAFVASHELVLGGNDAVIVNSSLIRLFDCPSSVRVLPLASYM